MSCGRAWEVEAVVDGRLRGPELASFERHLTTCADCAAERRKLAELEDLLRSAPTPSRTALEEERLRARLLRSANERLLEPRATRLPWIAAVAVVLAVVAVAATRPQAARLNAGGVRPEPPRESTVHDELPGVTAIESLPPALEPSAGPPPHARHASSAEESFEHGVASLRGGNFGLADEQLGAFQRAAPGDPRCEDAAYLRAVARWRMGDHETATRRARDYLEAYPAGLRRAEAERIIAGTAQ